MSRVLKGRNRSLLFRTYLVLAGGLLAVAIVLDLGFGYIQALEDQDTDHFLESTFQLVGARLADAPAGERESIAAAITDEIGIGVQLLARDEVHMSDVSDQRPVPLVDADGNVSYLRADEAIDEIILLGPIAVPRESLLNRLLPPLFYLSIFVVVGLWLRPLLRDIKVISRGAQRFSADYREPLSTAEQTTQLTGLAHNLDEMAARLSGVLRSQKELIAALSHEMRTPLARLRFALAVTGDGADEPLKRKLVAMNTDVQEIDDLIASMLNYARLDHPDIQMRWQAVPVGAWLRKIVEKVSDDDIQVQVQADNAPGEVWMDPRLMELALSNLLVNATKYAEQSVLCAIAEEVGGYVLTVEDDGHGVAENDRSEVFKAFSRTDDSRNRETGGYGLGLAVVARVAELHGGVAEVDASAKLGGARFSVRWRRARR